MAILGHQNCHAKPIGTPRNTEIQLTKGASIYDVHTEGRGGHKIPQICGQTVGKIRTGGSKICGRHIWSPQLQTLSLRQVRRLGIPKMEEVGVSYSKSERSGDGGGDTEKKGMERILEDSKASVCLCGNS